MFNKINKRINRKCIKRLIKSDEEMLKDLKSSLWDMDHDDPDRPIYDEWFVQLLGHSTKEDLKAHYEKLIKNFQEHKDKLEEELWDL